MSVGSRATFDSDFSRKQCQKAAGPYFEEMVWNYETTMKYLRHSDARARLGALLLIRDYWKPPPDFADLCERVISEDDNLDVRCLALNCLVFSSYYGSWDVRIGRWLASIVRDETQPLLFRKLAYFNLFSVRAVCEVPDIQTFRFPEEVDWQFVGSFFEERERPTEAEKLAISMPFLNERARTAIAFRNEAERAIEKGDFEGAIKGFSDSLKNEPTAYVFVQRGQLYLQLGRLAEAIADFTSALQTNPKSAKAYLGRAKSYDQQGLHISAERDRQKALELDPSLANIDAESHRR